MLSAKGIQIVTYFDFFGRFEGFSRGKELFVERDDGRHPLGVAAGPARIGLTGSPDGYLLLLRLVELAELSSGSGMEKLI